MTDTKSLVEIVGDLGDLESFVKDDEFLKIVNQDPPKSFVKAHPLAKGVWYIPIEIIETMLTKLFQHWNVEVLREGQLLNSVFVTVRLHYKHPITGEMEHQDGIGAQQVQVDKGKNASDLGAIKANAIMLALPAAKSYAIKDAAEHIGKVFGRDINRKDTMAFTPSYDTGADMSGFAPMNTLITVPQSKELLEVSTKASGLKEDKEIEEWFREKTGMLISQVKKVEFENVKQYIVEEHI